jgi:hypothetical protein
MWLVVQVTMIDSAGKEGVSGTLYQLNTAADIEVFERTAGNERYAIVMPAVLLNPYL